MNPPIVRIGLLDSGTAPCSARIEEARSFVDGEPSTTDELGHATVCLRALDAALGMHGVPTDNIRLLCAKVLSGGVPTDGRTLSRAIVWLSSRGVLLIAAPLSVEFDYPWVRRATERAIARGASIVASAGGDASRLAYPAAYPHVIAAQHSRGAHDPTRVAVTIARDDSRAVMYWIAGDVARRILR